MKTLSIFGAIALAIVLAGAVMGYFQRDERIYEERLIGMLKAIESDMITSNPDIARADLHSPTVDYRSPLDVWVVKGTAAALLATGEEKYVDFRAVLRSTCKPYAKPDCWQVEDFDSPGLMLAETEDVDAVSEAGLSGSASEGADETMLPEEPAPAVSDPASGETDDAPTTESGLGSAPEIDAGTGPPEYQSREELIRLVQGELKRHGYDPGPVDGKLGPQTLSAILAFQRRVGMTIDGEPSGELLQQLSQLDVSEEAATSSQ